MRTPSEPREVLLETACSLSNNACRLLQHDDGDHNDTFMLFNECLFLVETSFKQRQSVADGRGKTQFHDVTRINDFFQPIYFPQNFLLRDNNPLIQEEQITIVILYNMSLLLHKGEHFTNSLSTLHLVSSLLNENESKLESHPSFQLAVLYHVAEVTYNQNKLDNLETTLNGFIEALDFIHQQQQQDKRDLHHETCLVPYERISPILTAFLWSRTSGILLEAGYYVQANEAFQNAVKCHDTAALHGLAELQQNVEYEHDKAPIEGYSCMQLADDAAAPAA